MQSFFSVKNKLLSHKYLPAPDLWLTGDHWVKGVRYGSAN